MKKTMSYDPVLIMKRIVVELADIYKPPERLTVSQAAEKYRYLKNVGSYVGYWKNSVAPYMVEPMDELSSQTLSGLIFVGPAQSGKALSLDTKIATPTGWSTMGELKVGDTIFDENGNQCSVTFVTETMFNHQCYKVTFDDGSSIVADAEHKWFVRDDIKERSRVVNTSEMFGNVKYGSRLHRNRFAIVNAKPIDTSSKQLDIEPYLMGAWLGDGHAYSNWLSINSNDVEILDRVEKLGYNISKSLDVDSQCFTAKVKSNLDLVDFRLSLTKYKLLHTKTHRPGKFIPKDYLRASRDQRMSLMQGLMDTDGYICRKGKAEFCTVHEQLMLDFRELCASLGFKTSLRTRLPKFTYKGEKREGKLAYYISFFAYKDNSVFSLQRKVDRLIDKTNGRPTQTGSRRIVEITKVESVPVCCIQVDSPNHLYLAGEQMIPTHNTDALLINWLSYSVKSDPMDMIIYSPSMAAARDFSVRRVDRLHRHSPEIGKILRVDRDADNKFDKHYTNGMFLSLSWPSSTEFAGRPIPRVALTDYDRMDDDIDGEGSPYDLASKRTTTFGQYGMAIAESSPSREITDTKWIAKTDHEAPPTTGILALYNRGDRRRRYWPCPHCHNYFEGEFSMLVWEDKGNDLESAESVYMQCPKCGHRIQQSDKYEMNLWGRWVKDGQFFDEKGVLRGKSYRSSIASFWLKGVAAAFVTWKKLVEVYLAAYREFRQTGSEEALKKFYNTDLSEIYISKSMESDRIPEVLKSRAIEMGDKVVPKNVRFLVAAIDVQKNMFVVQIHGIAPGNPFDIVIIDTFNVHKSRRLDQDDEHYWVKPAAYLEDWDELIENVIEKQYPLDDDSGRTMSVRLTLCDSGGKEGVTTNAYNFYRRLKTDGKHIRFHLVKGEGNAAQVRARISYPDSDKKDRNSGARGDIPVLILNTNVLKDTLSNRLECIEPGKGMIHFPNWLPDNWYGEMCAEVRTSKGWENPTSSRNEAWDLCVYTIGACISKLLLVEKLDWANPPSWAKPWDENDLVRSKESPKLFAKDENKVYDFGKLAEKLA